MCWSIRVIGLVKVKHCLKEFRDGNLLWLDLDICNLVNITPWISIFSRGWGVDHNQKLVRHFYALSLTLGKSLLDLDISPRG